MLSFKSYVRDQNAISIYFAGPKRRMSQSFARNIQMASSFCIFYTFVDEIKKYKKKKMIKELQLYSNGLKYPNIDICQFNIGNLWLLLRKYKSREY